VSTALVATSAGESEFRKAGTSMSKTKHSNNRKHINLSTRQTVVAFLSIFALVNGA
jgi:hypothetical protein